MKEVFKLTLVRPARKSGGDRYETEDGVIVIYLPQSLSRVNGEIRKELELTVED